MKKFTKKKSKYVLLGLAGVLVVLFIGCTIYLSDYYQADEAAIVDFSSEYPVTQKVLADNTIVYEPENAAAGLIFYPGGKVEYTAYRSLMAACASEDILCVLLEMPFHLAVFDINAAEGIQELYPEIENWYIAGHSLGGSMAASYLNENKTDYEGLILLASYSTEDFSDGTVDVLSMYGSEDKVLNMDKYEEYKTNLPDNLTEVVIEGGCHAYFGMYGEQDGDGIPTITNEEQIEITAKAISGFVTQYKHTL